MVLTFVSNSDAKLEEYRRILAIPHLLREPIRDSETTNVQIGQLVREKCRQISEYVDPPFFVEHTSLEIDDLRGFPGVVTEPFLSRLTNEHLLRLLSDHPGDRVAIARVVIGYREAAEGQIRIFEGATRGRIAHQARGTRGFGWDQIFIPDGDSRTYAEMTLAQKNRTSMRARAAASFLVVLLGRRSSAPSEAPDPYLSPLRSTKGRVGTYRSAIGVFISYCHEDSSVRRELLDYLQGLTEEGFDFWYDDRITIGQSWRTEIDSRLAAASVCVFVL